MMLLNNLTILFLLALNIQCSDSKDKHNAKREMKPDPVKPTPKMEEQRNDEQPKLEPSEEASKDVPNNFLSMCLSVEKAPDTEPTIRTLVSGAGFNTDIQLLKSLRTNPAFPDDDEVYYGPISAEICEKTNQWLENQKTLSLAMPRDLAPIQGLRKLKRLYIVKGNIPNFASIAHNLNLEGLDLYETNVMDPSHLGYMQTLKNLTLDDVPLENINWLANLRALRSLTIKHVEVKNWSYLANLAGIEYLTINFTPLNDLAFLQNFTSIKLLNLAANQIDNAFPLALMSSLISLEMGGNKIKDTLAFVHLNNLVSLSLHGNLIEDISPLAKLKDLLSLTLNANPLGTTVPITEQNCPRENNISPALHKFCSR